MEIRMVTEDDDLLAISNVYERNWKYAYRGTVRMDNIGGKALREVQYSLREDGL